MEPIGIRAPNHQQPAPAVAPQWNQRRRGCGYPSLPAQDGGLLGRQTTTLRLADSEHVIEQAHHVRPQKLLDGTQTDGWRFRQA